jgi:hypothetical protein
MHRRCIMETDILSDLLLNQLLSKSQRKIPQRDIKQCMILRDMN